jgi:hypothetical protein
VCALVTVALMSFASRCRVVLEPLRKSRVENRDPFSRGELSDKTVFLEASQNSSN